MQILYWAGGIVGGIIVLFIGLAVALPTPPTETTQPITTAVATTTATTVATSTVQDNSAPELYTITKVVDGDTVSVSMNGATETIRLIGIDTPETVDPRTTVECFGKEASDKAKELLTGKKVRIEKDPSQGDRDKYQRLLAYVYREDGLFINKYMVENGYAYEYTYNTPYKYQSEFKAAQTSAQSSKKGLWAPGVCDIPTSSGTTPKPQSTPTPIPTPVPSGSGYSCSANIYNCTDFSSHAQAQAVYEQCGGVNNDVHGLDRDKDGSACE